MNYFLKFKKTIILIALLATIPIYFKITLEDRERVGISSNPYVFDMTRRSLGLLDKAINGDSSNWGHGMVMLFSPIALIMLPPSILADTLLFPYDAYLWYRDSKHIKFWKNVQKQRLTSLEKNEYLQHYTDAASPFISRRIRVTHNEELLRIYFDVASAHDELKLSKQIIEGATEHGVRFPELGEYMCSETAKDINAPKFSYSIFLMLGRHQYSRQCAIRLAEAGVKCLTLLNSRHLPEKYIRRCWQNEKTRYPQILAKNSATPADIHEKIYENSQNQKISAFSRRIITENLARYTTSVKLINELYNLNYSNLDSAMMFNQAVPDDVRKDIKTRQKVN